MLTRRTLLTAAIAAPALTLGLRAAAAPTTYTEGGLAVQGHDPIAYFDQERPAAGRPEHALMWMGAEWRFETAETRARFEADPERFAPAYGGHCAWAMAQGYAAPGIAPAWSVVDGRLYLNASLGIRRRWMRDPAGFIAQADANWPLA
ncbi:MAG: YHS domain-containing (seleno)protein [Paracoccaceae bacterium]